MQRRRSSQPSRTSSCLSSLFIKEGIESRQGTALSVPTFDLFLRRFQFHDSQPCLARHLCHKWQVIPTVNTGRFPFVSVLVGSRDADLVERDAFVGLVLENTCRDAAKLKLLYGFVGFLSCHGEMGK